MIVNLSYEGNNLHITKEAWDELKRHRNSVPFQGIVAAAKETITLGGAFIVYRESDTSVMRKCDRQSELSEEIDA